MPGAFLDDDIDLVMNESEFASSVTGGPSPYAAILDRPTALAGDGEFGVQSSDYMLTYKTASDPALRRGDVRSVGGVSYRVTEPPRVGEDGLLSMAYLERV
jgi:hypothetical protein